MKAELPESTPSQAGTEATPTPDTASIEEPVTGESSNSSVEETIQPSSASVNSTSSKGKQKSVDVKSVEKAVSRKKEEATADNLVGKINNLVTTDLGNITDSRDFLLIGLYNVTYNRMSRPRIDILLTLVTYIPLQIVLCIWFLYTILGWR